MAICPSESPAEKPPAERRRCLALCPLLLTLSVAALCLCLGFVEVHRLRESAELQRQILALRRRVELLEGPPPATPELARHRRAVGDGALRTVDGVPIISRAYGLRRRPQSEGLRIYETFLASRAAQPTSPSVSYETDDPSIQPHHRSSAAFHAPGRFGRVNTNTVIAADERPPAAASAPAGRVAGELHRRSRVSLTSRRANSASALTRAAGHRLQSTTMLEARGPPQAFVPPPSSAGGRSSRQGRPGRRQRCSAAHFEGHVSNISRKSSSYGGNGRMQNNKPDAMFSDWRPAAWMEKQRCGGEFQLYGGQVTVQQAGLYYLYAQINYLEDSDINGFEIQVNARSLIKCITMEASDLREKTNTCYTGAVAYLNSGDAVSVRDLEPMRHSLLLPDRSFFGLLQISSG